MSALVADFFDTTSAIPADAWRAVVPAERVFLGLPYLSALEAAPPAKVSFRYALIRDRNRPVAAAAFAIAEISGSACGAEPDVSTDCRASAFLGKFADRISLRLLVCGNLFVSGEHGFAIGADADPDAALRAIAKAADRIAATEPRGRRPSTVLIRDFYEPASAAARELGTLGYHRLVLEPNMVVTLGPGWVCFEDYLLALGAKYRKQATLTFKRGQRLARRRFDVRALEAASDRLHALHSAVYDRAEFRLAQIGPGYFARLKEALGERFEFVAWFLDDLLVGFATSVRWGDTLEGHAIGVDYEQNADHSIYLNMLYEFVRYGIECGAARVSLGRTALEIKSGVGAEPLSAVCYVRHRNRLSNLLAGPLLRRMLPKPWTQRHALKRADRARAPQQT